MRNWEEIRVGLDELLCYQWTLASIQQQGGGAPDRIKVAVYGALRYQDMPRLAEIFGTEHINFIGVKDDDALAGMYCFYVEAWA